VSSDNREHPPLWPGLPSWIVRRLNRHPPLAYLIATTAIDSFSASRGAQVAASLAYYALFSMFPLLLFVISALGFVLQAEFVRTQIEELVIQFFPTSQDLIIENLEMVLQLRGPATAIAALSLLWSGSGFFTVLAHYINDAWPGAEVRGPIHGRIVAVSMVGILVMVLLILAVYNTLLQIIASISQPLANLIAFYGPLVDALLSQIIPWIVTFGLFLTLYRLVPRVRVRWREALIASLVTTVLMRITTAAFGFYLRSGLSRYQIVYGSLGSVVALLFWIYLAGWITLFGAHLSAAIGHCCRPTPPGSSKGP
jgi:membrane protein